MRIIRALHDVAATRHIILTISRTIQLVGIIAAVVLLVALERRIDAFAVRAVERTCACINVTGGLLFCSVTCNTENQLPFADLRLLFVRFTIFMVRLTGRTGIGTTHKRKKRLARGQFPRLSVVCQGGVYAPSLAEWIWLPRRPETYIILKTHF